MPWDLLPSGSLLLMVYPFLALSSPSAPFSWGALPYQLLCSQLAAEEGTGKVGKSLFAKALITWSAAGSGISLNDTLRALIVISA